MFVTAVILLITIRLVLRTEVRKTKRQKRYFRFQLKMKTFDKIFQTSVIQFFYKILNITALTNTSSDFYTTLLQLYTKQQYKSVDPYLIRGAYQLIKERFLVRPVVCVLRRVIIFNSPLLLCWGVLKSP